MSRSTLMPVGAPGYTSPANEIIDAGRMSYGRMFFETASEKVTWRAPSSYMAAIEKIDVEGRCGVRVLLGVVLPFGSSVRGATRARGGVSEPLPVVTTGGGTRSFAGPVERTSKPVAPLAVVAAQAHGLVDAHVAALVEPHEPHLLAELADAHAPEDRRLRPRRLHRLLHALQDLVAQHPLHRERVPELPALPRLPERVRKLLRIHGRKLRRQHALHLRRDGVRVGPLHEDRHALRPRRERGRWPREPRHGQHQRHEEQHRGAEGNSAHARSLPASGRVGRAPPVAKPVRGPCARAAFRRMLPA